MLTPDNVQTIIGNNKIFSDTIQNFSTLPVRRVDCVAKVANSADPIEAIAELKAAIAGIPNAATNPAPDVEILSLARASGYPSPKTPPAPHSR